ncbi:glutaminyl-peptide cyclotransferase [Winogradskyella sp. DF17]|uniref:Glutaminyl-peptide cyclotransferase n=1 Tax=Winogradskyella pelagia TaxID=2819984 RepID=A0ABS3T555_9FLAO|nr:glutaminyl-peptide cyclotransferase [Winogradskyella sp. DF17]MBO3117399.1 glutaminyl-peptide cyclotransferase [Winogradskyella sp. DF17]
MRFFNALIISILLFGFNSCGDSNSKKPPPFSIKTNEGSLHLGDTLNLSINNPKNIEITRIAYKLNNSIIKSNHVLLNSALGTKTVTAEISYDGKTDTVSKVIKIYNNIIPSIYSYEIVNTYPHDITSYTQGLEFYKGELYESTGQKGESKLRKINFETGEVLKNINLDDSFFGEGITILNDKIYQLTWRAKMGFIYDVNSFERTSSFKYGRSKEGWGLCNDSKVLYKSDGTEKIWILNPENMTEQSHIEVYTEKGKIPSLNELEWIDGKIFANIYQRNGVVIVNPETGGVEGVIDFKPLRQLVKQHDELDVLNGIAYNSERQTIFVTGKNWNKLFEVKIKKN